MELRRMFESRALAVLLCSLILLMMSWDIYGEEIQVGETAGTSLLATGPVNFRNVSMEAGLGGIRGNFFSWGDFDRDGYQDLLIDGKKLWRNNGPPDYHFTDHTSMAGISSSSNSGVFGDFDNDGWMDIFCGGGRGSNDHPIHEDILWHNEMDGTYKRVSVSDGVPHDTFPTVAAGWTDMNRDGWLDLYMVNYENSSFTGYPDHFWMGDGKGGFINSTAVSGMSEGDHPYQGRGVSWCDFDNDGFQDAYVSNYRIMPNYLYRNLGNSTMEEVAASLGVEGHGNLHPVTREGPYYGHSLGSSWGDLDNDGDMDLWVTNLAHKDIYRGPICDDSYLFENLGETEDFRFKDVREGSGIAVKPLGGSVNAGDELMVSSSMADYDNDGDLDLFIPQIYGDISYAHSLFYRNDGDMKFTDVTGETGVKVWNTYGSAWCDYDNDGWQDLVTGGGVWDPTNSGTTDYSVHLYRNLGSERSTGNEWLEVSLQGRESNSAAIGARVNVEVDSDGDGTIDIRMMREVCGGTAAHGQQDSMILHFGLGEVEGSVSVEVRWPLGRVVRTENVPLSTRLEMFEPTDPVVLDLEIVDILKTGDGIEVQMELSNPTPFDIHFMDMDLVFNLTGGMTSERITVEELSAFKDLDIVSSFDGIIYEDMIGLEAEVERSFPPISDITGGTFLISERPDLPPVPFLSFPSTVTVGEEFAVDGTGSMDHEGDLRGFRFDFGDGTGTGWTELGTTVHVYDRKGSYNISLEVMDDSGQVCTEPAFGTIVVNERSHSPPLAWISVDVPSSIMEGDEVLLKGEGSADGDERITDYEWISSLDGLLSRDPSFREDDLSPGIHDISFKVKDSTGSWSEPVFVRLEVISPEVEMPWVAIDEIPGNGTLNGTIVISGRSGPSNRIGIVEVKLDNGLWKTARGTDQWEFILDTRELEPGEEHSLQARSFGDRYYSEIAYMYFEVEEKSTSNPPPADLSAGDNEIEIYFLAGSVLILLVLLILVVVTALLRPNRGSRSHSGMRMRGGEEFKE